MEAVSGMMMIAGKVCCLANMRGTYIFRLYVPWGNIATGVRMAVPD